MSKFLCYSLELMTSQTCAIVGIYATCRDQEEIRAFFSSKGIATGEDLLLKAQGTFPILEPMS
jgi:hypothetical protein